MRSRTLIGAGCGALLLVPALARGQAATISARDTPAWAPASVTVAPGEGVTFEAQGTAQAHFVEFTSGPEPDCSGVPMTYRTGEWSGTCTFPAPGDYAFRCPVHDVPPYSTMRGVVHVVAPAPTPTPPPGASPTPPPGTPPVPPPVGTDPPPAATQTALRLELARGQRGRRVRGRVDVLQAGSRLEVKLTARLKRKRVRVGRVVKRATAAGAVRFSVPLDRKGRRALRARKRLAVRVAVALTPPGAPKLTRSRTVKLRR